jgi:hypothetical protein
MSFYTARVRLGKARSEHNESRIPRKAEVGETLQRRTFLKDCMIDRGFFGQTN